MRWHRGRATTRVAPTTGLPGPIFRGMTEAWPLLNKDGTLQNRGFHPHPSPLPAKGEGVCWSALTTGRTFTYSCQPVKGEGVT